MFRSLLLVLPRIQNVGNESHSFKRHSLFSVEVVFLPRPSELTSNLLLNNLLAENEHIQVFAVQASMGSLILLRVPVDCL